MSIAAIRPWYLPTCVNIATPVTSPIAQTPSAARQRSSTEMPRGLGPTPTVGQVARGQHERRVDPLDELRDRSLDVGLMKCPPRPDMQVRDMEDAC